MLALEGVKSMRLLRTFLICELAAAFVIAPMTTCYQYCYPNPYGPTQCIVQCYPYSAQGAVILVPPSFQVVVDESAVVKHPAIDGLNP